MKIGVIGTGSIVTAFIRAARLVDGVEFTAVYSRGQESGEAFAKANRLEKVYTDLDLMLGDDALDVIYIASPNSLHFPQSKKALLAGKHVIVEKPFAGNLDRAIELVNLAKEKELFLFEAICNIHMPHFRYIQNYLDDLGKLRLVQANFSQYSSRYNALLEGHITNVFNPEFSGGALADINIYNIHFVVGLFGMPKSVRYEANVHKNGIDTSGILFMDYGRFKAELVGAKDSFSYNIAQIQGEGGYIMIPGGTNGLESVSIKTHDTSKEIVEQDMPRLYYQVEAFKNMVDNHDFKMRDKYLSHSVDVVKVAVMARKDIGLDFEF